MRRNLADDWPPLRDLADLALRHWNIRMRCPRCRHERVLHGAGLWWLFYRRRWSGRVEDVPKHFFCTRCRTRHRIKSVPTIDKTKDDPDGMLLDMPPDNEWKRLVSRYRS